MPNDHAKRDGQEPVNLQSAPDRRHALLRSLLPLLLCCLLAVVTRWWIAPQLMRLPADYAGEISHDARCRYRDTANGSWQRFNLIARRVDQTLMSAPNNTIIQGDIHWTTETGQITYESVGIYGVDRHTRRNIRGYGNVQRSGQFLFPPHVQQATYQL
ncbi:MAG TPA: hypothetical protein VF719_12845, partial [Abditibacteriaceae bacterium]